MIKFYHKEDVSEYWNTSILKVFCPNRYTNVLFQIINTEHRFALEDSVAITSTF